MDPILQQVRGVFIKEGTQLLKDLGRLLQKIRSAPSNAEYLRQFMCTIHNFRGGALAAELPATSGLATQVESVAELLRRDQMHGGGSAEHPAFNVLEAMRKDLALIADSDAEEVELEQIEDVLYHPNPPPPPNLIGMLSDALQMMETTLTLVGMGEEESPELRRMEESLRSIGDRAHAYLERQAGAVPAPPQGAVSSEKPPRAKILVADDTATVREWTKLVLEQAGFHVIATGDPVQLPLLIRQEQPNLVLIDVSLPRLQGDRLADMLEGVRIPPFMALYSSSHATELENIAQRCGADGYMAKTSDPEELLRRVMEWLQS